MTQESVVPVSGYRWRPNDVHDAARNAIFYPTNRTRSGKVNARRNAVPRRRRWPDRIQDATSIRYSRDGVKTEPGTTEWQLFCSKLVSVDVCMKDNIERRVKQYFGNDISRMRLLGITKYAVATYVDRVQGGWSKESAITALLFGRRLSAEETRFVRSVLDRLPSAAVKGAGTGGLSPMGPENNESTNS